MRFVRRKNLREGEEFLCIPQLHWIYVVKPLLYSLPFFIILLCLWFAGESLAATADQMGYDLWMPIKLLIRQVFLAGFLLILVVFVVRILVYVNTEYGVTNKRLMFKKGLFNTVMGEIPTDRIESIYCVQSLFGRIFHYGSLCISGVGGMMPVFYMVCRPFRLRRLIVDIIEKNKTITVVHGDIPRAEIAVKPAVKPEPPYRYGTFVRVLPKSDYIPLS